MQKHQRQVGPWYYPDALFDVSGTSVLLSHSTASWLQLLLQSSSVSADDLPSCCSGKQKPSDEYYFIWPPSNAQPPTGTHFPYLLSNSMEEGSLLLSKVSINTWLPGPLFQGPSSCRCPSFLCIFGSSLRRPTTMLTSWYSCPCIFPPLKCGQDLCFTFKQQTMAMMMEDCSCDYSAL